MAEKSPTYEKPYVLDQNIEAMLCYLPYVGVLTSLAIFAMEKTNKFVRFHALQGFLLALAYFVITRALIVTLLLIWTVPFVTMATFFLQLLLMWRAYNNEEPELPIIGKLARDQVK